jgi:primary-amine oxidase
MSTCAVGLDTAMKTPSTRRPHPFSALTALEIVTAAKIVRQNASLRHLVEADSVVTKIVTLLEPPKRLMIPYLDKEHRGTLQPDDDLTIPRCAEVHYCLQGQAQMYMSVVCLTTAQESSHVAVPKPHQGIVDPTEYRAFFAIVASSSEWAAAVSSLGLPAGVNLSYDVVPYGADKDTGPNPPRYIRGWAYALGAAGSHPESNMYSFPLPLSPVVDVANKSVVRIDPMPAGGIRNERISSLSAPPNWASGTALDGCQPNDYHPDLLPQPCQDLRPLHVVQPEGVSFTVTDGALVEWQKWRFRVRFDFREGMVLHDIRYDNRSLFYRLNTSEMTVPYADPRAPYHIKQAFDLGDAGAGAVANPLRLGCDCLGSIYYFDGIVNNMQGKAITMPNAICLHEEDGGVLWKHTNGMTGVAVAARSRVLVIQTTMTLGNYDYIMAWRFDQAAGLTYEISATGILSTCPIDPGSSSRWGTVVSPRVLAQNHQHLMCVRIDPAIDGHQNSVQVEEAVPLPLDDEANIHGNAWEVRKRHIEKSSFEDADPLRNRTFKIVNEHKINGISGNPVGYKVVAPPSQLLLAHPSSVAAKRAKFAQHHLWVSKYRDGDLWAGGKWTTNSYEETDGISSYVARDEDVRNEDLVVWVTMGMTHIPRVEDFPVMPTEKIRLMLKPADFFSCNPGIDVPTNIQNPSSKHTLADGTRELSNDGGCH